MKTNVERTGERPWNYHFHAWLKVVQEMVNLKRLWYVIMQKWSCLLILRNHRAKDWSDIERRTRLPFILDPVQKLESQAFLIAPQSHLLQKVTNPSLLLKLLLILSLSVMLLFTKYRFWYSQIASYVMAVHVLHMWSTNV